jgi:branched-subunit amino acid transport protein
MRVEEVLIILCMAAATFFTRFASPLLLDRTGVPGWLIRLLKHVPTAMLTALIAPALLAPQGYLHLGPENHYLLAGAVAAFMAWRGQHPAVTMGSGMAVMLVLRMGGIGG